MRKVYEGFNAYAEKKLAQGPNARAMLYQEIARLGMSAFEPGATVVWATAYAFPMVLFQPFDLVPFDFEYSGVFLATTNARANLIGIKRNKPQVIPDATR